VRRMVKASDNKPCQKILLQNVKFFLKKKKKKGNQKVEVSLMCRMQEMQVLWDRLSV
jgi:hypothetical protein